MLSDYEIAQQNGIKVIQEIAKKLGVEDGDIMP